MDVKARQGHATLDLMKSRNAKARKIEALLHEAGFSFTQQHGRASRLTFDLERPQALAYTAG